VNKQSGFGPEPSLQTVSRDGMSTAYVWYLPASIRPSGVRVSSMSIRLRILLNRASQNALPTQPMEPGFRYDANENHLRGMVKIGKTRVNSKVNRLDGISGPHLGYLLNMPQKAFNVN